LLLTNGVTNGWNVRGSIYTGGGPGNGRVKAKGRTTPSPASRGSAVVPHDA
jgi:hypothetical protein